MSLNLKVPRTGKLMLCRCGHVEAFHYARPDYYGGPVSKGDHQCGHCACVQYVQGDFQGYNYEQSKVEE
jgi:hypothetical protein